MNKLTTSPSGLKLIETFESFAPTVYTCPAGKPTIGFGHVIRKNERFTPPITLDQARRLMASDVKPIELYLNAVLPGVAQYEFDALVSFCFNVGIGAFDRSTLRRRIKQGNKYGAAAEFARWNRGGGKVLSGLIRRRNAERAMFLGVNNA